MIDPTNDGLHRVVPSRALSDGERELLRVWVDAGAGDVAAYAKGRLNDDPATIGQIVVTKRDTRQPLYRVQSPAGADFWVVTSVIEGSEVGRFPTLRSALNGIRPNLPR
jgi:hypothetical protein